MTNNAILEQENITQKNKSNVVVEHGIITKKADKDFADEYKNLSLSVEKKHFDELSNFAKTEAGAGVFNIRNKSGKDCLIAKNYVGIIQTKSGFTVEILPKIYLSKNDNQEKDETEIERTRKIFIKMLKSIRNLPDYKNANFANLRITNMSLLEVFITMFIKEVFDIVKKGLKSRYTPIEENSLFLKGKLLTDEHIRKNFIHKERFFVKYDNYLPDIPENRILKRCIYYLKMISKSQKNISDLKTLLFVFDEINESKNIDADFNNSIKDRTMSYYHNALLWANLFLRNKSFTSYKGSTIAFALLFPMERVFEAYVAYHVRKKLGNNIYKRNKEFLKQIEGPISFNCQPDMAGQSGNNYYIIDAKWKILDKNNIKEKYKISQPDIYQLFAYSKLFGNGYNKIIMLVYPKTDNFDKGIKFEFFDKTNLNIIPFDVDKDIFICDDEKLKKKD